MTYRLLMAIVCLSSFSLISFGAESGNDLGKLEEMGEPKDVKQGSPIRSGGNVWGGADNTDIIRASKVYGCPQDKAAPWVLKGSKDRFSQQVLMRTRNFDVKDQGTKGLLYRICNRAQIGAYKASEPVVIRVNLNKVGTALTDFHELYEQDCFDVHGAGILAVRMLNKGEGVVAGGTYCSLP